MKSVQIPYILVVMVALTVFVAGKPF